MIRSGLRRCYVAAMAKMRPDEARKSLQALAALLPEPAPPAKPSEAELELELIRSYLAPLKLAGPDAPASELARLAVDRLLRP